MSAPTIVRVEPTDDDGTGTTGTIFNKAWIDLVYAAIDTLAAALFSVAGGGTGVSTLAAHGVVIGNGTSAVAVTAPGTAGQVLTSNGASADPTFQAIPAQTLTSSNATLGADVTVVNANTWYDGPSLTLAAGTWLLTAQADVHNTTATASNAEVRLSTGSTHYASAEGWTDTNRPITLPLTTIVVLGGSTTIKIQIAATIGSSAYLLKAATLSNGSGNLFTQLNAVKIA